MGGHRISLLHPVEQVNWTQCTEAMTRMALMLPSEAQWEYACRAGSDTPWWTGADRESLRGKVNFADQSVKRIGVSWSEIADWPDLDDGWASHAPVGTFAPNPFGLHEMHGNVWEWCLDGVDPTFYAKSPRLDPVSYAIGDGRHKYRGGSFCNAAPHARSANRYDSPPEYQHFSLGLRPARALRTTR
jgi:formylglycine-generating enzyme required for sulfatase activity